MIEVRPIELSDANNFVAQHHRHHKPVQGHRFSVSSWERNRLCGVAICGRPVAKAYNPLEVLEVLRLCTDGTPHACSCLYAACARAAKAIGYRRIQTYILDTESGTSLKAAGWTSDGVTNGGQWQRPGDWSDPLQSTLFQRNRTDQPVCNKVRWCRFFGQAADVNARARVGMQANP